MTNEHDGIQLWENGPFWATCNLGAEKPQEAISQRRAFSCRRLGMVLTTHYLISGSLDFTGRLLNS